MGGTVAAVAAHGQDFVDYAESGLMMDPEDIAGQARLMAEGLDLVLSPFLSIPSNALTPKDWLALVSHVRGIYEEQDDLAGLVITHGTATLEETAYFLNLTLRMPIPVVLVGSQRPQGVIGSDAPGNVADAILVARDVSSHGLGVLVVFNGEIFGARDVVKGDTYLLNAFRSRFGPLGVVDPGGVAFYRSPTRRHYPQADFNIDGLTDLPKVDIVSSYAGSDGLALLDSVQRGSEAIVLSSLLPGAPTPSEAEVIKELTAGGTVIVYAGRGGHGRVFRSRRNTMLGLIGADDLTPQKARVLIMLLLATGVLDRGAIERAFSEY